MPVPQMDAVDHQQIYEKKGEKLEDDHRLQIALAARFQLDKASVIKYENGLAYHTANKSIFRQANAICESALTQTPSNSDSEKRAQQPRGKASNPAWEPDPTVKKLSKHLSTRARLETRLDGAQDRLETLAGSNHRGYAAMRAWTYHFDAVAELVDALAQMEKGILEDEGIKAFVAGEKGREKINGTGGEN